MPHRRAALPVLADKIKRGRVGAGEEAVAVPTAYCLGHEPGKDLKLFTVFDRLRPQLHRAVPGISMNSGKVMEALLRGV